MSFISEYAAQLREQVAKRRTEQERIEAEQVKREPKRKLDYAGTVTAWWNNQPPKMREHPWSLKTIAAAAFADSPLVKDKRFIAFGAGIIWYFWQSEETTEVTRTRHRKN